MKLEQFDTSHHPRRLDFNVLALWIWNLVWFNRRGGIPGEYNLEDPGNRLDCEPLDFSSRGYVNLVAIDPDPHRMTGYFAKNRSSLMGRRSMEELMLTLSASEDKQELSEIPLLPLIVFINNGARQDYISRTDKLDMHLPPMPKYLHEMIYERFRRYDSGYDRTNGWVRRHFVYDIGYYEGDDLYYKSETMEKSSNKERQEASDEWFVNYEFPHMLSPRGEHYVYLCPDESVGFGRRD